MEKFANDNSRLHAIVSGIVQGVGFRYFVLMHAEKLKIKGWVRNTTQGDVEIIAEGNISNLEKFLELLKTGPQSAKVLNVITVWQKTTGEFLNFQVKPTA